MKRKSSGTCFWIAVATLLLITASWTSISKRPIEMKVIDWKRSGDQSQVKLKLINRGNKAKEVEYIVEAHELNQRKYSQELDLIAISRNKATVGPSQSIEIAE
mgnify:CR=1 FL=1